MPRIVKGRRCAAIADVVVAVLLVVAIGALAVLLGAELADWRAERAMHQPAGNVSA